MTPTFLKSERAIAFLKSEKAIDGLRWVAAFVAVGLAYGAAGWMLLRPTGWQLGVNGPVVEINLPDLPQLSGPGPGDRASEPASPVNPPGANAPSDVPRSADDQQGSPAERAAGGLVNRTDTGAAARDADAMDAKDRPADAERAAASEKADKPAITPPADATLAAPPKTEPPVADSGGAGRPTAAPPRVVPPDTSTTPSVARAPIDTSITVNQGRLVLRGAKGSPQVRGVSLPQLKLTLPLATPTGRNEPFSKRPNPIAGSTLPVPGPTASAANHGHAQDLAQKPAMGIGGGLARNAIGTVIDQHAVVPHAGAPLGIHSLPGAMSAATHGSGEHGPATTATGAPLAASHTRPGNPGLPTGAASPSQAGHPDQASQASQVASMGSAAINGAGLSRPTSSTAALSGPAKVTMGGLNGSSFRAKHP